MINFKITEERLDELTWEQIEIIENPGKVQIRKVREILASFVIDANGEYLALNDANALLLKLKRPEMNDAVLCFVERFKEHLLPKANGN